LTAPKVAPRNSRKIKVKEKIDLRGRNMMEERRNTP
jgi:hypothetical protein